MYEKIKKDSLDLLLASRYKGNSSSEDDTAVTFIGNKIFTTIGKIFFKLSISDILYTYVIGNTQKILKLHIKNTHRRCILERTAVVCTGVSDL